MTCRVCVKRDCPRKEKHYGISYQVVQLNISQSLKEMSFLHTLVFEYLVPKVSHGVAIIDLDNMELH